MFFKQMTQIETMSNFVQLHLSEAAEFGSHSAGNNLVFLKHYLLLITKANPHY